jgi:hypothetical protein
MASALHSEEHAPGEAREYHQDEHHQDDLHPNPIMTGVGLVSALAIGWLFALLMPQYLHAPRFAVGIAMIVVGILFGASSNASAAFPNLQRFMETFGVSLVAFGFVRYLNIAGIMGNAEGFVGLVGKVLALFM